MTGHHDHPESAGSVHPEDLDLYALDALPVSESDAVEDALVSASLEQQESMRAHITSTREIAAELVADAGIDVPPPPALRARVLDLAAAERRRRGAGTDSGDRRPGAGAHDTPDDGAGADTADVTDLAGERERRRPPMRRVVAAAAAAVVLLAGGVLIGRMTDGAGTGEQPPVAEPPAPTMPEPVSDLLSATDLEVSRGEVTGAGGATVLASRSVDMAVITMAGLPDPGQGRAYQLWLMGPDHDPIPSGTMESGDVGPTASARVEGIADSAQIGLTEEPAGGSPAPTGDVLLALDLA